MVKGRIELNMSGRDIVWAMSHGNPGAMAACSELLDKGDQVDPNSFSGGLSSLLILDTLGIYEERIFKLWDGVCGKHIGKMIAVLRAYQLGQLAGVDMETLNHAIDNRGAGIDLDAVVKAVQEQLPWFNLEAGNT